MTESQRQLHIRIPARLHRALRVRAAAEDKTIQELVVEVLSKELATNSLEDDDTLEEGGFNGE
jgi:predicted HicB family RNase H-like nuclease